MLLVSKTKKERLAYFGKKESQLKAGVDITHDMVGRVRHGLAGIQDSAPFAKVATALAVIKD